MQKIIVFLLFIASYSNVLAQASRTEVLIKSLSKEKFEYMNPSSLEKLADILDDRLIFIHSNGLTEDKEELLKNLKNGKWDIIDVKLIGSPTVRVFKNDTAVLTGKGTYHIHNEGKEMTLDLVYTEVWTHYKKGWKLVSRHANRLP